MNLEVFLRDLHFHTEKARPQDDSVDWEDAPLPYKLYRGLPTIGLSSEVPLELESPQTSPKADLRELGHFLWYVFGLNRIRESAFAFGFLPAYRRFVPSGGALYPNELYVYLKMEDLPYGVYHYDAAHHRLVLLREGNFDAYVSSALGGRCRIPACFCTVFVSTMFWKNYFKYKNFAFRLQGLDAGALIGQLLEVAKRFGYSSGVYFQFLDRAVNHLLGISEKEESVYAVIPLSVDPAMVWFKDGSPEEETVSSKELCRQLPKVLHNHFVRSQKVLGFPMLIKMNEASFMDSRQSFRQIGKEKEVGGRDRTEDLRGRNWTDDFGERGRAAALPRVHRLRYDLALVCKKRYSPETEFVLGSVDQTQLAVLLQETFASFSYRNDLDGTFTKSAPRVSLYGCFYGVEGILDGAYRYDSACHTLLKIRPGDHRHWLQQAMFLDNVNLFQVPLCLHVAGDRDHLILSMGYRGYRIQQMEAGMLVERLLLTAVALGMGGRPLLGFDAGMCDDIYNLSSKGKTCLIQIPIGPCRPSPCLEGSLHG